MEDIEEEFKRDQMMEQWKKETVAMIVSPDDDDPRTEEELMMYALKLPDNRTETGFLFTPAELMDLIEQERNKDVPPSEEEIRQQENEIRQSFLKDKIKGTYDLAIYLAKKYSLITVGTKDREIYVYQDGLYTRAENTVILPEIQRILNTSVTKNAKIETIGKIQDHTYRDRSIFSETTPDYIPVKNGVYNLRTGKLMPHSPKYFFKYQIPIVYDPNAQCPEVDKFLETIFTDVQRQTIEEWAGYCLYRNYMYKKALIIVGEGDTGKTTFLELLCAMIGEENRSAVSLHRISSDKFSSAQMYDKHLNMWDELSAEDVHDTGNFKIATGGSSIVGEFKFGDQFQFRNFAKLTFACNKIPDVKDMNDEAYFNRWMVIHMEKTIPVKIRNYAQDYLLKPNELAGFFNLAIKGLKRLLQEDGFSYKNSGIDTKLEMMRSGSSLAVFITERCYKEPGAMLSKAKFYDKYARYCYDKDIGPETENAVGRKLLFYAPYATDAKMTDYVNGKMTQVRGWRNINVRLTEEEMFEQDNVENMMLEAKRFIDSNPNIPKIISN